MLNDPDLDNLSADRLSREIECNLGQVSVVRSEVSAMQSPNVISGGNCTGLMRVTGFVCRL